jgi:hypothetical protein
MSFRLEEEDLEQLRALAKTNRISLNALLSQIVHNYLRLWVYDLEFGFFAMSEGLIGLSLSKLTDKEIEEIAVHEVETAHKEIIRNLYGRVTKTAVLEYLDVFGRRFDSFKMFHDGASGHTMVITHKVNLPFSRVYYHIVKAILALAKIETIESERDISEHGFSLAFET